MRIVDELLRRPFSWPTLAVILPALTIVCGAVLSSGPERRSHGGPTRRPDLTVATFNLNFGLAGDPDTLEALEALEADVVVLQETNPAWERSIRERLSERYPHQRFVSSDWPAGGAGVLSRHPLRRFRVSDSPVGWFPAIGVVVAAPAGDVQIIGLHLKPPVSAGGSVIAGYFSTPAERRTEMEAHLQTLLDADSPAIVAGDFNEARGGGLAVARAAGLVDALRGDRTPTWRWPVGPFVVRQKLDHVLYGPGLTCLDARVVEAGRSDHLPIVARFVLRAETG